MVKKKGKKEVGAEKGISKKELERELDDIEEKFESIDDEPGAVIIKASKPISKIKKGDKIKIDGEEYEVDNHYVLIDHKTTKEMAIEVFDKEGRDYQVRYFDDQVERTLEFYELQGEIMFVKKPMKKIEW
ncbi:MAG: hypothetical protein N3D20_02545 [Candidatus Pacearchaeota archaeon]|nr:hypothetical protein [Candidatus Pacearchaeota archaeon]